MDKLDINPFVFIACRSYKYLKSRILILHLDICIFFNGILHNTKSYYTNTTAIPTTLFYVNVQGNIKELSAGQFMQIKCVFVQERCSDFDFFHCSLE